jgi:hypothetical protein
MQITVDIDTIDIPGALTSPTGEDRTRVPTLREDPHIRRQFRSFRDAMDSLESAVSASNESVIRTLDMVRMLVQGTDVDPDSLVSYWTYLFNLHSPC